MSDGRGATPVLDAFDRTVASGAACVKIAFTALDGRVLAGAPPVAALSSGVQPLVSLGRAVAEMVGSMGALRGEGWIDFARSRCRVDYGPMGSLAVDHAREWRAPPRRAPDAPPARPASWMQPLWPSGSSAAPSQPMSWSRQRTVGAATGSPPTSSAPRPAAGFDLLRASTAAGFDLAVPRRAVRELSRLPLELELDEAGRIAHVSFAAAPEVGGAALRLDCASSAVRCQRTSDLLRTCSINGSPA